MIDKYILVNANQNNYNIGEIELLDDDLISLNFNIGVEYNLNHADPSLQDSSHPLAPQFPSMHWGWAAGYRFAALEGMIDKNQDSIMETVFQYHPVDDSYYSDTITCDGIIENQNNVDCYILNTCHIRDKAKEKVFHEIGRIKKIYRGKTKPVMIIAGCVAQAENQEVLNRDPYVDIVIGPQSYHKICLLYTSPSPRD